MEMEKKRFLIDLAEEEYQTLKRYAQLNKLKIKPFAEILLRNILKDGQRINQLQNKNQFAIIRRFFSGGKEERT
jgi:hypothetical protein